MWACQWWTYLVFATKPPISHDRPAFGLHIHMCARTLLLPMTRFDFTDFFFRADHVCHWGARCVGFCPGWTRRDLHSNCYSGKRIRTATWRLKAARRMHWNCSAWCFKRDGVKVGCASAYLEWYGLTERKTNALIGCIIKRARWSQNGRRMVLHAGCGRSLARTTIAITEIHE